MGGNALSVPSRRIERSEYILLESKVLSKVREKYIDVRTIKFFESKPDFGDMDILIAKQGETNELIVQYIKEAFDTKEVVCNTDVISFELEGFQIDFIFMDPSNMEAAEFYFSYNDLNNLIGRTANQFGLKFGHNGLTYIDRGTSGNILNKLTLTKEPRRIYEFLGYDYDRYLQGFDTIEEVFEFVKSGKYFSTPMFAYENLNHQNRTRNKKRKVYEYFLEYISDLHQEYPFKPEREYLDYIDEVFPEVSLKAQLIELEVANQKRIELKEKFSGKVVLEVLPNIKPEKLGKFIQAFKSSIPNFDLFIEYSSEDVIKAAIESFNSKIELVNKLSSYKQLINLAEHHNETETVLKYKQLVVEFEEKLRLCNN